MHVVVVTGTGTEVGKTWVSCAVLEYLREAGLAVAARKPVQSHEPSDIVTDADLLGAATGEESASVCPPERTYEIAMAPPMAGAILGRAVPTISDLAHANASSWTEGTDFALVEGAGGLLSPIGADGHTADLIAALSPATVVIVADAGLGTVNLVRLSAARLEGWPTVVFLNRFEEASELHQANRVWLVRDGFDVFVHVGELAERLGGGRFGLGRARRFDDD